MRINYIIIYLTILCIPIHSYCQSIDSTWRNARCSIPRIRISPENNWEKIPEGKRWINIDDRPTLSKMIQIIPSNAEVSIIYFLKGEYFLEDQYLILGYTQNNQDIFVDSNLKRHTSLKELLKKRYGSVKRYKKLYTIHEKMENCAIKTQKLSQTFVFTQAKIDKNIREFAQKDYFIKALNTKNKFHDLKDANSDYFVIYYNKKNVILYDRTRDEMRVGNVYKIKNHYYCALHIDSHKRGSCYE